MLRYQGAECPVCTETFAKGDDIVVCPVCGAPHHRHCYTENAGCALEEQHALGKEWQPAHTHSHDHPGAGSGDQQAVARCGNCGGLNPPSGIFCQLCGSRLKANTPDSHARQQGQGAPFVPPFAAFSSPYGGINPEEEIEGITMKELSTYVGSASYHYLPRFKLLTENNRLGSFNWSAFFFTFFYFLYRKMNRAAAVTGLILALTLVPSFYYAYEFTKEAIMQFGGIGFPLPALTTPALERILLVVKTMQGAQFGLALACGLFANRLYLKSAAQRIKKLRARVEPMDTGNYIRQLAQTGGVSAFAAIIGAVCVFAAYFLASYLLGAFLLR